MTIVVDASAALRALQGMLEWVIALARPHEEEIMCWEDDGGSWR